MSRLIKFESSSYLGKYFSLYFYAIKNLENARNTRYYV